MSDQYIPDNEPGDILSSLKELSQKSIPHAPTFKAAADTIEALRAENARLREALKPFAEVGECESASFSYHFIRAARAAMGEIDND